MYGLDRVFARHVSSHLGVGCRSCQAPSKLRGSLRGGGWMVLLGSVSTGRTWQAPRGEQYNRPSRQARLSGWKWVHDWGGDEGKSLQVKQLGCEVPCCVGKERRAVVAEGEREKRCWQKLRQPCSLMKHDSSRIGNASSASEEKNYGAPRKSLGGATQGRTDHSALKMSHQPAGNSTTPHRITSRRNHHHTVLCTECTCTAPHPTPYEAAVYTQIQRQG